MNEADKRVAAGRVAGQSDLLDVRLTRASIEMPNFPAQDVDLRFDLTTTPRVQYDDGADSFAVSVAYDLTVTQDEADGGERRIADISFTYAALFDTNPAEAFTDESLESFAETTGQFALYPYAREYIQDLTGRLGLPPLTLGLLKVTPEANTAE